MTIRTFGSAADDSAPHPTLHRTSTRATPARSLILPLAMLVCLAMPSAALCDLQWTIVAADTTGDIGRFCSLALDAAGNPHISYRESTTRSIWYAVNQQETWAHEPAHPHAAPENSGTTTTIAVDTGELICIAYERPGSNDLWYAERSTGVWTIKWADFDASGANSSVAFDALGQPHVAHRRNTFPPRLQDKRWAGTGWITDIIDDVALGAGQSPSLKRALDGTMSIAYQYGAAADLKFAEQDSMGWIRTTVDAAGSAGWYSSLAIDSSGTPHISYQLGPPSFDLLYAVRVAGVWQRDVVDTAGTTGYYTSIATDGDGNPWIAYVGFVTPSTFAIKLATKSGGAWTISAVDTVTSLERVSLAIDALGRKHVAYYDAGPGDLMYAVSDAPTDVAGSAPGALLRLTLAPNPALDGRAQFSLLHSDLRGARVDLYDTSGRRVRSFAAPERAGASLSWSWDGTDDSGRAVAAGVYVLRAETAQSRTAKKLVVLR